MNSAGAGIEGVSVLLAPVRPAARPADAALAAERHRPAATPTGLLLRRTDGDGAFSVMLPPGRYVLAAYKPGFELAVTEIGGSSRGPIEIRLPAPAGRAGEGREAREAGTDLDWILRHEGGDVLRERAAAIAGAPADPPEAGAFAPVSGGAPVAARAPSTWLGRIVEPIDGRFTYQVGTPDPFSGESGAGSSSRAATLGLEGRFGGRGRWSLDGMSGRSVLGLAGPEPAHTGRRTGRLAAVLDWRLTPRDAVRAAMGFQSIRTASRAADAGFIDSVVRAGAGVLIRHGDHVMDFGVRTGAYRHELRDRGILIEGPSEATLPIESGETGRVVSLHGMDDWRLTGLYVLSYGLGYHGNPALGRGFLVPRVGLTREPEAAGGLRVRSVLLFRADDAPASVALPAPPEGSGTFAARRIGGMLSVDGRPAGATEFAARLSYLPFAPDLSVDPSMPGIAGEPIWNDSGGGMLGDEPVLLTDGAAGLRAFDVELRRSFGTLHGSLSGSVGRVEGRVAAAPDDGPAYVVAAAGGARYLTTHLRAMYAPTDTEVRIGWRRVVGAADPGDDGGPLDYRRVDVVVAQDLPRWSAASPRLRLLMAYQDLAYDTATDAGPVVPAAASRFTGGVAIEF